MNRPAKEEPEKEIAESTCIGSQNIKESQQRNGIRLASQYPVPINLTNTEGQQRDINRDVTVEGETSFSREDS